MEEIMSTKIMIDSASDINKKEAEELGIILMPMIVGFGEEEFLDGVNLLPAQFYEKLKASKELPKTSQITAYRFEEQYEKVVDNGDDLVVITISSKLSGTYNQALMASEKFNGKVQVVDSMNACIGERLLGLYAIELVNEGKTAVEVKEILDNVKSKIHVMAVIDTLEYLKRGGRISSAVAFAGSLLSIKPIIAVEGGEVKLIGKAMGTKRGIALLNSLVDKKNGIDFNFPYGLVSSGEDNGILDKYRVDGAYLWAENGNDIKDYQIGSTIGTHVGPGAVGIAFFEK